jgi:TRAP-type C4-dicarboxylate transport system substrate-binding protein
MLFFHFAHLCLAAVLLLPLGAASAQEIRISHQWAEGTDARDRAVHVFVQEAEMRAKGLKFRVYPKSSFGIEPREILAALQGNKLEMAVYPLVYAASKVREFSLAGLPGLVPDLEAVQALKGSEIEETLQALAEANGFRILSWWWNPGGFLSRNREVTDATSVAGLKMRAADPLFGLMLKAAGASVVTMPSPEIYAAMQAGSVDTVVASYETFISLRIYEQAKFATVGSPSLFMGFAPLVMSLTTWNKLTPEQKMAVEEAAVIADSYFDAVQRDVERRLIATLRKAGVTVRKMTREDYLSWLEVAQRTAWLEYAKINPQAKDLLFGAVRTFLNNHYDAPAK